MDQVRLALGEHYRMFFHPALPVDAVIPGCGLNESLSIVNQALCQNPGHWHQWNWQQRDEAARLVRVNWIYQRLELEPIRKPVLLHEQHDQLHVLCGDTRLMALNLLTDPPPIPAIITCEHDRADKYQTWVEIRSDSQLIDFLRFDKENTTILFSAAEPGCGTAIRWFEIGDSSTAHHLHDEQKRWQAFCLWHEKNPIKHFCKQWARSNIEWTHYGL